jgi:hypothetical protein
MRGGLKILDRKAGGIMYIFVTIIVVTATTQPKYISTGFLYDNDE